MKEFAEKEVILTQPKRMLKSGFSPGEWNNHYNVASLLSGLGASWQEILSLCAVHSDKLLR